MVQEFEVKGYGRMGYYGRLVNSSIEDEIALALMREVGKETLGEVAEETCPIINLGVNSRFIEGNDVFDLNYHELTRKILKYKIKVIVEAELIDDEPDPEQKQGEQTFRRGMLPEKRLRMFLEQVERGESTR